MLTDIFQACLLHGKKHAVTDAQSIRNKLISFKVRKISQ